METAIEELPKKIKTLPHWRVRLQPSRYEIQKDKDPTKAFNLMEQASVRLGGWNYPYIGKERIEQIRAENYIASGCDWSDIVEYWRLYYSGQFIHLFATWERTDEKLLKHTRERVLRGSDVGELPGIISISNILFILTKVFEFAARLCEKHLYKENLKIVISLENIENYALTTDWTRCWHSHYPATAPSIKREWDLEIPKLLAKCNELSLDGMIDFYKHFGWDEPSVDVLRKDQADFLAKTSRR